MSKNPTKQNNESYRSSKIPMNMTLTNLFSSLKGDRNKFVFCSGDKPIGEVAEWPKAAVLKTVVPVTVPWVRILPSPFQPFDFKD